MREEHYILLPPGGYCYGVEAGHKSGDIVELHGGFRTITDAAVCRDRLITEYSDYAYVKVVKIETPEA